MTFSYRVTKTLSGYSCCFRQWRAHSHCQYLHGYDLSFKLHFAAQNLDHCHWVIDFGLLKDSAIEVNGQSLRDWFDFMFDHTTLVSDDDPKLKVFEDLAQQDLIQLHTIPHFSTEKLAEYILTTVKPAIIDYSDGRVHLIQVDVFEHDNNCASYCQIESHEERK